MKEGFLLYRIHGKSNDVSVVFSQEDPIPVGPGPAYSLLSGRKGASVGTQLAPDPLI
jgi:hypothetical protein